MKQKFLNGLAGVLLVCLLPLGVWGAEGENSSEKEPEADSELKPGVNDRHCRRRIHHGR